MATTTPDNLRTPDPGIPYNLVADLATLASDTQEALKKRANLYVGTAAQRAAFTTAAPGVAWKDTDGIKMLWFREGTTWVPAVWQWAGSAAQMNAFTEAPVGFTWFNTTASANFHRTSSTWIQMGPYAVAAGTASRTTNLNTNTGATISVPFPVGRFTQPPKVTLAATSGRITAGRNAITKDSFLLSVDNWSTGPAAPFDVDWIAVQMTSSSSAG